MSTQTRVHTCADVHTQGSADTGISHPRPHTRSLRHTQSRHTQHVPPHKPTRTHPDPDTQTYTPPETLRQQPSMAHKHTYTKAHMYTEMLRADVHTLTDTQIHKYRNACANTHAWTRVHTHMSTRVHTGTRMFTNSVQTHIHRFTNRYVHTHSHVQAQRQVQMPQTHTSAHRNSEIHGRTHTQSQPPRDSQRQTRTHNTATFVCPRRHTSIAGAQCTRRCEVQIPTNLCRPPRLHTLPRPCAHAQRGSLVQAHAHAGLRAPVPQCLAEPPPRPIHLSVDRGQRLDRGQGVGAGHAEAADGAAPGRQEEAAR